MNFIVCVRRIAFSEMFLHRTYSASPQFRRQITPYIARKTSFFKGLRITEANVSSSSYFQFPNMGRNVRELFSNVRCNIKLEN